MIGIVINRWRWLACIVSLTSVYAVSHAQPRADLVRPYRAAYALFNGDQRVGHSEFSLSFEPSTQRYAFESRSEVRGWLRLLSPRPVIERSEFLIANGQIQPLNFVYEDGSRGGRRNFELRFDANAGAVEVGQGDTLTELLTSTDALDIGTMRVALMLQLAMGAMRGSFDVADRDGMEHYEFQVEASESTETGLGTVAAQRVRLQRPESSRLTQIWAAPELGFLIARMEQHREGRDVVAFVLESVEWLDGSDSIGSSGEE